MKMIVDDGEKRWDEGEEGGLYRFWKGKRRQELASSPFPDRTCLCVFRLLPQLGGWLFSEED